MRNIDIDNYNNWLEKQKNYEIAIYGSPRNSEEYYHIEYIYIYYFFNRKPKDKKPIFSPPNRKRHRLENIIQTQQDIMKHLDEYTKLKVFFSFIIYKIE